jgi:hypothetical protein
MSKSEYSTVYFSHITKIFLDKHFQHGKIFFDNNNIFCHVNGIFKYLKVSFMVVVMAS